MRRFAASSFIVLGLVGLAAPAAARELSFDERVEAQRAIERVYHSHLIGARKPFEQAAPRALLEGKVRTYLAQSAALAELWNSPITGEALSRELGRMARGTRLPERLRELYAALGDDPVLIAECLARPVLADRLSRGFFDRDERLHGMAHREAELLRVALLDGQVDMFSDHPQRTVMELVPTGSQHEPSTPQVVRFEQSAEELESARRSLPESVGEPSLVREEPEAFVVEILLEEQPEALRVARYAVPKVRYDAWWTEAAGRFDGATVKPATSYDELPVVLEGSISPCPEDVWENGSLDDPPEIAARHTAVWTGTEMIVWGGIADASTTTFYKNTGSRYDPATDTWSGVSSSNVPSARSNHTAVWTGTHMIVWGGEDLNGAALDTGGRYDPVTNSWSSTSMTNAPAPRKNHTTAWSGTWMVVWGGESGGVPLGSGGRYDPVTDSWAATTSANAPAARSGHSAVWAGNRLIVWGGANASGNLFTGGRYDPAADVWTATNPAGGPLARRDHRAVWTGSVMVVWGGTASAGLLNSGGRYDPVLDSWSRTSSIDPPAARIGHTAVWTGDRMVVWGGRDSNGQIILQTGGVYDPVADNWQHTTTTNTPPARHDHTAVWTGTHMVVWGGLSHFLGHVNGASLNSGARYDPATDSWTPTTVTSAPSARVQHTAVWTGTQMIVWGGGGFYVGNGFQSTGGRYDPATDSWSPTSTLAGVPAPRAQHTAVWTGSEMIVWGGVGGNNTGGRYDPIANTWTPTATSGSPAGRFEPAAVWTGSVMVVWGGIIDSSPDVLTATGGRYDPVANTWTSTSTSGAPSPREGHTAVWTGSAMIVWGGDGNVSVTVTDPLNTGARYDPVLNSWTSMSTTGAPSARVRHSAVWTGTDMIVWGGIGATHPAAGASYDPGTDAWLAVPTLDSPLPREAHTAVWTGSEMVVWGGSAGAFGVQATGGRYDPLTQTWAATSTVGAPSPRYNQTAVWTAEAMIVWGGESGTFPSTNTGGLYGSRGSDADGDGLGDACDACPTDPANDVDLDGVCASVDNCASVANPGQQDADADHFGDACDNCPTEGNPQQSDFDDDQEGNVCDLDDGLILIAFSDRSSVEWQQESGFDAWNAYRGDLVVLRASGTYTQAPGSNALAGRDCGLPDPFTAEPGSPPAGEAAFWLVTGVSGGSESSLGTNSAGSPRPNANPCP